MNKKVFGNVHRIYLDCKRDTMKIWVEVDDFGALSTYGKSTYGYYIVQLVSSTYTKQYETTINGRITTSGERVMNEQKICLWR